MSYIGPRIKAQFDSLSAELKNVILNKNVKLHTLNDLISVLEEIVSEG